MTELLTTETIVEIARETWTAFLSEIGAIELDGAAAAVHDAVTGSVDITGAWNGAVELTCSRTAARLAAATMYALDEASVTDGEVLDAVGELVNIVGGNIKSLLPGPTDLSLPSVHDTAPVAPDGAELEAEALLAWTAEPVAVRVWAATRTEG